jgi:hypothetical protein
MAARCCFLVTSKLTAQNGLGRSDRRTLCQTEGSRLRSAARLSSGATCRPAKPGRNPDGASGGNCTPQTGFAVAP